MAPTWLPKSPSGDAGLREQYFKSQPQPKGKKRALTTGMWDAREREELRTTSRILAAASRTTEFIPAEMGKAVSGAGLIVGETGNQFWPCLKATL